MVEKPKRGGLANKRAEKEETELTNTISVNQEREETDLGGEEGGLS